MTSGAGPGARHAASPAGHARAGLRRLLGVAAAATVLGTAGVGEAATPAVQEGGAPADTDTVTVPRDTAGIPRVRPGAADTLPEDTLAADTVPLVDIQARQQALEGGDFPSRDSTFQRLLELPGYRAIEYRGRDVQLDVEREEVQLREEAQTNYGESVLEADTITYLSQAQFIVARGNIRLVGTDRRELTSDSVLYYDVSRLKGTIMGARTSFAERGAQWFVSGTATPRGTNTVFVVKGDFTTCELEEPHYWFKAGKIKVVTENIIVAWPIVLYVHGVPVAWLPFFAQDIRPGRRSGFLPPRFGVNDIFRTGSGLGRSVTDFGYYLAVNDYMDTQFTTDWFAGRFVRVNGAFRYRFLKSFVRGNVLTSYSFGDDGRSVEIRANHDQELSPNTDFRLRAGFVQNTRLFQDRTFDPRLQTQTIDSDVGLNHRFPFANFQLSGRRRQFLGNQAGRTELELPALNMTFSPITLFGAPRGRAGAFNNVTLTGSANFNRRETSQDEGDDVTATRASASNGLRLGNLSVSSSASFDDQRTTPFDQETGEELDPSSVTNLSWNSSLQYQLDLMGSTVLRPTVSVTGSQFKSPDTGNDFLATPTRLNVGATLSTDVYGFLPGIGPLARIRHKISPNFTYTYAPPASVADSLLEIPGFPARSVQERNTLNVALRQTFEAKVKPRRPETARDTAAARRPGEPRELPEEEPPVEEEEAVEEEAVEEGQEPEPVEAAEPAEAEGLAPPAQPGIQEEAGVGEPTEEPRQGRPGEPPPIGTSRVTQQEQTMVLLAINTSALEFDFAREEGPVLVTERVRNSLSSDLLRGFSVNMTHDLFEGTGEDREFSPFLAELTGSFSINSAAGLGGLIGLPGRPGAPARTRFPRGVDSRYRLADFEGEEELGEELPGAGPWNLSLTYSLRRTRPEDTQTGEGTETQSLAGTLSLNPTPNWRFQWSTQYNITDKEFGQHLVSLDRDLHRWQASFIFSRSPNGNFLFQVSLMLKDAPELRLDYDEQTQTGR